ncbi:MAG TPA: nucleotidyltransferase family protein [Blastocatellia bacterium]|nr:nucleotidyltransferase family protein [Blastocatellia bacterium]
MTRIKEMISAIVPAAGMSTRMGSQNKLLLPINGKTLIERTVDTLIGSNIDETIVVVGHQGELVKAALTGKDIVIVENPNYKEGMASSIRAGVAAATPGAGALLICLADQPLLEPADLNRITSAMVDAKACGKSIVVPFFKGQRGNPVILDAIYRNAMIDVVGDIGCKKIIKQHPDEVYAVEMETDHVVRDIDTIEEYRNLDGMA